MNTDARSIAWSIPFKAQSSCRLRPAQITCAAAEISQSVVVVRRCARVACGSAARAKTSRNFIAQAIGYVSRVCLSLVSLISMSLICSSKKDSEKVAGWRNVIMNSAPAPFATTLAGAVQLAWRSRQS